MLSPCSFYAARPLWEELGQGVPFHLQDAKFHGSMRGFCHSSSSWPAALLLPQAPRPTWRPHIPAHGKGLLQFPPCLYSVLMRVRGVREGEEGNIEEGKTRREKNRREGQKEEGKGGSHLPLEALEIPSSCSPCLCLALSQPWAGVRGVR